MCPKVLRAVDQEQLVTALAGAQGAAQTTVDFLLDNVSRRMSEGLREQMEERGSVKAQEVEEAQNAVIATIRDLESAGALFLLTGEET